MQHEQIWRVAVAVALVIGLGITMAATVGCLETQGRAPGTAATVAAFPADYKGKPWNGQMQVVPGKVLAPYYDVGGEGVAYHDYDTVNHGSGELNRGPEEKNNFRKNEGISISYTKSAFDHYSDGAVMTVDQYYVGWTSGGEWIKMTVDVKAAGAYTVNLLASSHNQNAQIGFDVNGVDQTGPITLVSTGDWHTWGWYKNIATLHLAKGPQVITFKFIKEGNMNVQYFELLPAAGAK